MIKSLAEGAAAEQERLPQAKKVQGQYKLPTYDEVARAAKDSVLSDFYRVKQYREDVAQRKVAGLSGTSPLDTSALLRQQQNGVTSASGASPIVVRKIPRTLKMEDTTSYWTPQLQQLGLFGVSVSCGIGSLVAVYMSVRTNQMLIVVAPILFGIAYRSWEHFESASEEVRYVANQQLLRDRRTRAKQPAVADLPSVPADVAVVESRPA